MAVAGAGFAAAGVLGVAAPAQAADPVETQVRTPALCPQTSPVSSDIEEGSEIGECSGPVEAVCLAMNSLWDQVVKIKSDDATGYVNANEVRVLGSFPMC